MKTIILNPKDKDEQLLRAMEENRKTPKTDRKNVLDTIQNILNEDRATYKQ